MYCFTISYAIDSSLLFDRGTQMISALFKISIAFTVIRPGSGPMPRPQKQLTHILSFEAIIIQKELQYVAAKFFIFIFRSSSLGMLNSDPQKPVIFSY